MSNAAVTRSACGKVILIGEHAVVYGRPAIALPVTWLRTTATVEPRPVQPPQIEIIAPDINSRYFAGNDPGRPLARICTLTRAHLACAENAFTLTLTSQLPVGGHLGSGAAASVATARAVAAFCGTELDAPSASALAFEVEKTHHGTPSGVDNTVIAHEQPVWFVKGAAPELIASDNSGAASELALRLVIADSGVSTPTKVSVAAVRDGWQADRARYEAWFDEIDGVAHHARMALYDEDWPALGMMMDHNHEVLCQLGVSCPELDVLVGAAKAAGALGAKLTGGGMGGNMIALAADVAAAAEIAGALRLAGAKQVFAKSLQ